MTNTSVWLVIGTPLQYKTYISYALYSFLFVTIKLFCAHNTNLTPPLVIEGPVSIQES
jgi:hypothetical protein